MSRFLRVFLPTLAETEVEKIKHLLVEHKDIFSTGDTDIGHCTFVAHKINLIPFPGSLRLGLLWFNWWVSFAPEFQCCYFCESSCLFYLSFNFDFYVSKIMHL